MRRPTKRLKEKKHIVILSISIAVMLLFISCGKKGDPRPTGLSMPGGINDLSGEVKDGALFLSFSIPSRNTDGSEVKDLGGYKVFKACGSCLGGFEPFKDLNLDEKKGYTLHEGKVYLYDDDLVNGFQYGYKVYPYTKKGTRGDASNTFTIKWQKTPGPVKDVSVIENDEKVELSWQKEEGISYNVYRYDNDIYPLFPLNKSPLTTPYFLDSGLENTKKYTYEVRKLQIKDGVRWEGDGVKLTATPKDRTPPSAPVDMKAGKEGSNVLVTWKQSIEKDFAGYSVFRIISGKAEKLNKELLKESMYLDEAVPNIRYLSYYVITIDTAGNESEPSREIVVIVRE